MLVKFGNSFINPMMILYMQTDHDYNTMLIKLSNGDVKKAGFNSREELEKFTASLTDNGQAARIRIKYHADIDKLTYIDGKSDWIDLRAAERVELKKGDFKLISLGVSMEIPEGYEAHLAPRSSTFKNYGLLQTNSIGVIDNSYSGDNDVWKMPVYATRDTVVEVNDRIAQFRIVRNQPKIEFEETKHLSKNDRGGFGSTGIS